MRHKSSAHQGGSVNKQLNQLLDKMAIGGDQRHVAITPGRKQKIQAFAAQANVF